jgi:hypothetical protein
MNNPNPRSSLKEAALARVQPLTAGMRFANLRLVPRFETGRPVGPTSERRPEIWTSESRCVALPYKVRFRLGRECSDSHPA